MKTLLTESITLISYLVILAALGFVSWQVSQVRILLDARIELCE